MAVDASQLVICGPMQAKVKLGKAERECSSWMGVRGYVVWGSAPNRSTI